MRWVWITSTAMLMTVAPFGAFVGVDSASAQQGVSQAEVIRQLQESGLNREQVKARLAQAGYDPALADRYFDIMETQGTAAGMQAGTASQFLLALQRIGITTAGLPSQADTTVVSDIDQAEEAGPEEEAEADSVRVLGLPIFGRELFRRGSTEFQPLISGPVGGDYRLGPGDQLVLIITGDVETALTLEVMRDGNIVIPDVGTVPVNGLTMDQLDAVLYERLGRVYSGIRRGPEATASFNVTVSRIRTNQVVVAGDVEVPGSYPVSSLATAFSALYKAGGPTPNGTFRNVRVRRGGDLIAEVDLYDYLLRGDGSDDVRLESGDFVFVPVAGARVGIQGAIRRPATYEMLPGEGLRDLLRFAGGPNADAIVRRVQIDRILPPDERTAGIDRVFRDVNVGMLLKEGGPRIALKDGDVVRVFAVGDARRNRVTITGEVYRQGVYEWEPGLTLGNLISAAEGLDEQAYTQRAHIYRLDTSTGKRRLIPASLLDDSAADIPLADRDSVVVFSRGELATPDSVVIDGFVKRPGTYELAGGMTLRDLILRAGGFVTGARITEAEVARMPDFSTRSDTVAEVETIALTDGSPSADIDAEPGRDVVPDWAPAASDFVLADGDQVFVRKAAGYEPMRTVTLTGEVVTPSSYVLDSRDTRITDVIRRAGGLTAEANIDGVQLFREEDLVAVDLDAAEEDPGSPANFVLEHGDSLYVPKFDPTVLVIGNGVAFQTRVPYRDGEGLHYYIEQAGGYTEYADPGKVSVTYQNGQRAIVRKVLAYRRKPQPRAGSTVVVPEIPPAERIPFNMLQFASTSIGLLSSAATLLALLNSLN